MNLEKALAKGYTKKHCEWLVNWVGSDKKRFSELILLFLNGEGRIQQLAAWPMSYCVINHPSLIAPWFRPLVNTLEKKGNHAALTRNIVRLLQAVDIPKRYQGRIMNACFYFIQSPDQPPAVKAFSLTILYNLSLLYPEILPELKIVITERWPLEKAAFRSRAKKVLNK